MEYLRKKWLYNNISRNKTQPFLDIEMSKSTLAVSPVTSPRGDPCPKLYPSKRENEAFHTPHSCQSPPVGSRILACNPKRAAFNNDAWGVFKWGAQELLSSTAHARPDRCHVISYSISESENISTAWSSHRFNSLKTIIKSGQYVFLITALLILPFGGERCI